MGGALDTYCGQSYGAKQYQMLGIHMQRALVVLLISSIPLAIIWGNAGSILLLFGQDPEISAEAGRYAHFMVPTIFANAIQECHVRFLRSQNNVVPMMITSGITSLQHVLVCWLLVYKSGLGSRGAALANCISYWLNSSLLMLYVRTSPSCKQTWTGFSTAALRGIPDFLKLAIPSAIMFCLEYWSFEMMVLLSGRLPNPQLETSALSISFNICRVIYMIPLGLGAAISTRMSNELGAGRPRTARLAVRVAMFMVAIEGILVAAIVTGGRNFWGRLYSKDEKVVKYLGKLLLWLAASLIFDGIQTTLSGVIRGCGWQKIGAAINLGAYYLVGIPCSVVLAFVCRLGGEELWTGIVVAIFIQALAYSIMTLQTNWDKESQKAIVRISASNSIILAENSSE